MARKAAPRFLATTVTPTVENGVVTCECGSRMTAVNYVSVPSGDRWHYWRCVAHEHHITAALPK